MGLVGDAVREVLDAGAQVPGGLQEGKRRGPLQALLGKSVISCHKCSLCRFLLFLLAFGAPRLDLNTAKPHCPANYRSAPGALLPSVVVLPGP